MVIWPNFFSVVLTVHFSINFKMTLELHTSSSEERHYYFYFLLNIVCDVLVVEVPIYCLASLVANLFLCHKFNKLIERKWRVFLS